VEQTINREKCTICNTGKVMLKFHSSSVIVLDENGCLGWDVGSSTSSIDLEDYPATVTAYLNWNLCSNILLLNSYWVLI